MNTDLSGDGRGCGWYRVTVKANELYKKRFCTPLAGRKTILGVLVFLLWPPATYTQIVYSVSHWRLGTVAVVAVVLPTVYIIREPPSGW